MVTPVLVAITDPQFPFEHTATRIRELCERLPRGAFAVLFRDKINGLAEVADHAQRIRRITTPYGVPFFIARDIGLARRVGADGVHFASDADPENVRAALGDRRWVSIACHSDGDVIRAVGCNVTAVFVSSIFDTPSEGGKAGRGISALERARTLVGESGLRVFALGGVTSDNAAACMRAGAQGVVAVRAFFGHPPEEAERLLAATRTK